MSDTQSQFKKSKPLLDRTITYGHILTAISFLVAGMTAFVGMRAELKSVDQRVARIETTLQQLADVVVLTARQDERLKAIEQRLNRFEQSQSTKHP